MGGYGGLWRARSGQGSSVGCGLFLEGVPPLPCGAGCFQVVMGRGREVSVCGFIQVYSWEAQRIQAALGKAGVRATAPPLPGARGSPAKVVRVPSGTRALCEGVRAPFPGKNEGARGGAEVCGSQGLFLWSSGTSLRRATALRSRGPGVSVRSTGVASGRLPGRGAWHTPLGRWCPSHFFRRAPRSSAHSSPPPALPRQRVKLKFTSCCRWSLVAPPPLSPFS